MKNLVLFSLMFSAVSAQAATFKCAGKNIRQHGELPGYGKIVFDESYENGIRVIQNVKGIVVAGADDRASAATLQDAYTGHFNLYKLAENPLYRPHKYTNSSQFDHFDANVTTGAETGMWGKFVLSKTSNSRGEYEAHYIFQAGDHMGGTLHLVCKK